MQKTKDFEGIRTMPELKNYRIFISHSWDYNEHYEKVKEWLNNSTYFKWSNYSVPFSNPIETSSKEELKEKIENKISLCNCIIIHVPFFERHQSGYETQLLAFRFF